MLRFLLGVLGWLALIFAILLSWGIWRGDGAYGIAHFWDRFVGPPDLGPVVFARITRSPTANDALICPTGECGSAPVDATPPVFAVPVARLRDEVRVIEVNDPDVFPLARNEAPLQDRYLARTRLMRFPDTINVRFIDLGEGRSTLALYSRSQIGRSDFGVNRARLDAWIAELKERLPVAQP